MNGGVYSSVYWSAGLGSAPFTAILISLEVFTNTKLSIKKSKDLGYERTTTTPNQAPELAPKLLMCSAHLPPSTLSAIAVVWSEFVPVSEASH